MVEPTMFEALSSILNATHKNQIKTKLNERFYVIKKLTHLIKGIYKVLVTVQARDLKVSNGLFSCNQWPSPKKFHSKNTSSIYLIFSVSYDT